MKEHTVCRTLPGCGGDPGEEIGEMLRSVSAKLCFTITTAAQGSGVLRAPEFGIPHPALTAPLP